jgi:hydroxymethylpyrimidine/phosphomethylpyrimidine kinase
MLSGLHLDQLKVFFTGATFGTHPVRRHVFPARAGSNTFFGQTGLFVVDPPTYQTHPSTHFLLTDNYKLKTRRIRSASIRMGPILLNPLASTRILTNRANLLPNAVAVQASYPPLILIFGPLDPSGSSGLPADAITCSTLGCHALSTITALTVQDTARTEEIQPVSPELIDDQARCLLEDMTVQAIKVGPLYTTESASVLAQIAADYSHVPLVLHLQRLPDSGLDTELEHEDLLLSIFELLLPQTDIVVADHHMLEHWYAQGIFGDMDADKPAEALLQYGAKWVLSTGAPLRAGQSSYFLQGPDRETATWPWHAPAQRLLDADGPLCCAITAGLAQGQAMQQAVENAINVSAAYTTRHFRPGMGQHLINRAAS